MKKRQEGEEGGKAIAMGEVMGIIEKVWATCAANHSFAQRKRQQQVLKLFPLALMVMVMVLMMIA